MYLSLCYNTWLPIRLFTGEIMRCFGKNTLNYIKGLADGHIDYLPRLPQHLLVHILRFLDLEDLSRVACLSKMFRKVRYTPLPPSTSTTRPGGSVKGGLSVQDVQEGKIHTHPPSTSTTRPGGPVKGGLSVQDVQEGKIHTHPPSTSTTRPGGSVKGGLSVQDVQEGKIQTSPTLHLHH